MEIGISHILCYSPDKNMVYKKTTIKYFSWEALRYLSLDRFNLPSTWKSLNELSPNNWARPLGPTELNPISNGAIFVPFLTCWPEKNKVKIEHSDIMYYPGTRCQIICSSILKAKMLCDVKGNLSVSNPISAGANRDTLYIPKWWKWFHQVQHVPGSISLLILEQNSNQPSIFNDKTFGTNS